MTGHERIASKNIEWAVNWIVGGYYNTVQDHGEKEWLPDSRDDLVREIYDSAINNKYAEGYEGFGKAPREMKFAGKDFIMAEIERYLQEEENEELIEEIAEYAGWKPEEELQEFTVCYAVYHSQKVKAKDANDAAYRVDPPDGVLDGCDDWEVTTVMDESGNEYRM